MRGKRISLVLVSAALLASACSPDAPDGAVVQPANENVATTSEPPAAPTVTTSLPAPDAAEAEPETTLSLRFEEAREARRSLPAGARELGYRAFVGSSAGDPRFIELTLLEFGDVADAESTWASVRDSELAVGLGDDDLVFAFVPDSLGPVPTSRRALDLAPVGPTADRVFYRRVSDNLLVSGAAHSVHQNDVATLLSSLGGDQLLDPEVLPSSMRQVVDVSLPTGVETHFRSPDGDVVVTVFDGAAGGWFDYATHGELSPLVEGLDVSTVATRLSYEPPTSFGFSGQPIDAQELTAQVGPNLVVIEYPPAMHQTTVVEILARTAGATGIEFAASFADGDVVLADSPEDAADSDPTAVPTASAPDAARLAELQAFAEEERGLRAAGPVEFEFLEEFPGNVSPAFFVSGDIWTIAVLLGLVDPVEQDPTSAGQARVERLRGTPGSVVLQPSAAFTEAIVVHEIVHVLEAGAGGTAAVREVVDPIQALHEGSPQRVMLAWVSTLDDATVAGLGEFPWIFPPEGDPRLSSAMQDIIEFAYDEGADFAVALHAAGGNPTVDAAFADPPGTSEHILFPEAYLSGDEPVVVAAPAVPVGGREVDSGSLGAFVLSLAVRAGDETTEAELDLVRSWAGDSYVVYELADQRCLEAAIVMDDGAAAAALASALRSGDREVAVTDSSISLSVCVSVR